MIILKLAMSIHAHNLVNVETAMKIQRLAKYYKIRFRRLRGNPIALAGGTALGVFIGLTPTIPLHTILIIILAFITRTSTIAAILSSIIICNPLTYIPIYYGSILIGNAVTPYQLTWDKMKGCLDILLHGPGLRESLQTLSGLGYEALVVLVVGGCILALPFAIVSYYYSKKFFIAVQKKRAEKHILR